MSFENILFEVNNGVGKLTLNRPDKLNSFTVEMHEELRTVMTDVENDGDIRVLMLTGAGRAFCSGADLSRRQTRPGDAPPDLGESLESNYNPLMRRLAALPKPIIAAVNGVAAGAGSSFALSADIVLAARSAYFLQPFCRLGLVPDAGGTWALPRLVGVARAKGMSLLGEKLPAETAEQWGLIWKVLDDADLMPEATKMAEHLATQPTFGLGKIRHAINASLDNTLDQQLDLERDYNRECGLTHDFQEGVSAFMEKRPPEFKGR